ncbi:MAG: NUDIX hydrolase [Patescibacteria group bacterium]
MSDPIKTAAVVVLKEDRVLLVRHGAKADHQINTYGLPAGKVQLGEIERDAALREFREETGLAAVAEDLLEIPKLYSATIQQKEITKLFSMKVYKILHFTGTLKNSDETTPEWAKIVDLPSLNLLPNVALAIRDALQM